MSNLDTDVVRSPQDDESPPESGTVPKGRFTSKEEKSDDSESKLEEQAYYQFMEYLHDEQFKLQDDLLDPRLNRRLRPPSIFRADDPPPMRTLTIVNRALKRMGHELVDSDDEYEDVSGGGRKFSYFYLRGPRIGQDEHFIYFSPRRDLIKVDQTVRGGNKPRRKHRDRWPGLRAELQKLFHEDEMNWLDPIEQAQRNLEEILDRYDDDLEAQLTHDERFPLPPPPKQPEVWLFI